MSWASNNREKTNKILREWRLRNPEKAKENCRQWAAKNPDKVIKHNREWYAAHKEQSRENSKRWYANNPQKQLESSRKWRMKYPDKAKAIHQRADAKQRSTPKGKLSDSVSRRMNKSLNGLKSHRHWEDIVDYTIEQLRAHLEKRFKPGMTWENYGTYWHIDHKTPVSVFNYERPEDIDFRLCWSLKNLQPMEAKENISKGARINQPFQPSLAIGGLL
jgi:hypothetical protein